MGSWLFQGNPDRFDIDGYLGSGISRLRWLVRQKQCAESIAVGDEVFLWRASGSQKLQSGIVARCEVTAGPGLMPDDDAAIPFWVQTPEETEELRVEMRILDLRLGTKEVVKKGWLEVDPVCRRMQILQVSRTTNYALSSREAARLADLVRNTGRPWTRDESLAGLAAYVKTYGQSVSRTHDSLAAEIALQIGRAVPGVYNKILNFRAIDPRDERKGLDGVSHVDEEVWSDYFDSDPGTLDDARVLADYGAAWGAEAQGAVRQTYDGFGEAPDDDPAELALFAAKVRKGQPKFRKNLLRAYEERCAVTGSGPAEVLEAAHVLPHAESGNNALDNGLLLRSDIHSLLDAGLIRIEPDTCVIHADEKLRGTDYEQIDGAKLRPTKDGGFPRRDYLMALWTGNSQQLGNPE